MRAVLIAALMWVANIIAAHADAQPTAVFIGSSSISRWQSLAEDFPHTRTINKGVGGSLIKDIDIDRDVVPYDPQAVVIYAGENDLWAGATATRVAIDLHNLVLSIRHKLPKTTIVLISIKPSPSRWATMEFMIRLGNYMLPTVCVEVSRCIFVDVFELLVKNGQPDMYYFDRDNLHFNRAGYRLLREYIAPLLK